MIQVRKSKDRGHADHGWLFARHSFSFSDYYDPAHMGFSVLRVINEDQIAAGEGFPTHGHQNMEIITYIVEGALAHKDSMGNTEVILPGEVQVMSAGTGVRHSEFNHDKTNKTHLLQIWLLPNKNGVTPRYDQKSFESEFAKGDLVLVASETGREGSVMIHQAVDLYALKSKQEGAKEFQIKNNRKVWIQIVKGVLKVNEIELQAGDGCSFSELSLLSLQWAKESEFLLFDLP